jgi:hypothetical protein
MSRGIIFSLVALATTLILGYALIAPSIRSVHQDDMSEHSSESSELKSQRHESEESRSPAIPRNPVAEGGIPPGGMDRIPTPETFADAVVEMMEHDLRAPTVLGTYLDRKTSFELRTPRGMEAFTSRFAGITDFSQSVTEVHHTWEYMHGRALQERDALLGITDGMIRVSGDEELKKRLLTEFDQYYGVSSSSSKEEVEYAERAIQIYLNHSQSTPNWEEALEKRGIPILRLPASVPEPTSSPPEEDHPR